MKTEKHTVCECVVTTEDVEGGKKQVVTDNMLIPCR